MKRIGGSGGAGHTDSKRRAGREPLAPDPRRAVAGVGAVGELSLIHPPARGRSEGAGPPPTPEAPGADPASAIVHAASARATRRAVEASARRMERVADACLDPQAANILRRAAARARTSRSLSLPPLPRSAPAPVFIAGALERSLRGSDEKQRLHLLFRPDDPDVAPFTVPRDVVAGLPSGASCSIRVRTGQLGERDFELRASPDAFVRTMLADVVVMDGRPFARGRGTLSPFELVPIRSPRAQQIAGQAIIAEVSDPASERRSAVIREVLGHATGARATFLQAATEAGAALDFPDEVKAELAELRADPGLTGPDLTAIPFVTIDNEDSKDLDQALFIEKRAGGGYVVHYAIADVAHFVKEGGAIDQEARRRGLTTYLPDRMLPVLPPELSEDLCSLVPRKRRRAFVVKVELDPAGRTVRTEFSRGIIRSRAKLSYRGVQAELDRGGPHKAPPGVAQSLRLLQEVGELRMGLAFDRGVLFSPDLEARIEQGEAGAFVLQQRQRNDVERYNEQISLLANEEVGRFLARAGVKVLHRVHQPPAEATLASFREFTQRLGVPLGAQDLAEFFHGLDPADPRSRVLWRQGSRLQRKATYSIEPLGHDALKLDSYDHFTAPMRRYPDVVVHRVLAALIEGRPVPHQDESELRQIVEQVESARRRNLEVSRRCGAYMLAQTLERQLFVPQRGTVVELGPAGAVVELHDSGFTVPMSTELLRSVGAGRSFRLSRDGQRLSSTGLDLSLGQTLDVAVAWADPKSGIVDAAPAALVRSAAR